MTELQYWMIRIADPDELVLKAGVTPLAVDVIFHVQSRRFFRRSGVRRRKPIDVEIDPRAVAEAIAYSITRGKENG